MAKFRKKPVVIEAWQWNGEKAGEMPGVCQCSSNTYPHLHTAHENTVDDRGQSVFLTVGDWIIPEAKKEGRFYPCKPDVFADTYEPADTPQALVDAMVDAMAGGTGVTITRVDPADYGAEPGAAVEQSMTVDEMVARGVDRESAEFICGQQWTDQEIDGLLRADAPRGPFEPIGEAMKRVVGKIKPEGDD